jgi:hypothetical protein
MPERDIPPTLLKQGDTMAETVIAPEESSGFRFSWGLAFAGGTVAMGVILFLLVLGSGFGLLLVNPVKHTGPSTSAFLTGGAIYFFAAQAFGFAVGGHIAGRLLGPQLESRWQEEFRAAAHGLVAWAIAILGTVLLVALAGAAALRGGLAVAPLYGAHGAAGSAAPVPAYIVDGLFWPEVAGATEQLPVSVEAVDSGAAASRAEAVRILQAGLVRGEQLTPTDHDRLVALVARQAHIPQPRALERVDSMQANIQSQTRNAADAARKATSYASLWIAFSLLFGGIVAVFSAITARLEDDRDYWNPLRALRR